MTTSSTIEPSRAPTTGALATVARITIPSTTNARENDRRTRDGRKAVTVGIVPRSYGRTTSIRDSLDVTGGS
jgi:hypothetical protein